MEFSVREAQSDMRHGYYSGATGILASSLAWFLAAGVAAFKPAMFSVWALLIAGMFIFPAGLLICKLLGSSGAHSKGNPLGKLAGASTFWLIFSLPIAYLVSMQHAGLFFSAMLLIIGGRYLVFATIYGMTLYWSLGLALAGVAVVLALLKASVLVSALAGATVEAVFAVICLMQHRRWVGSRAS